MFSFLPKSEKTSKEQKSWIAGSLLGLTLDKRLTSGKRQNLKDKKLEGKVQEKIPFILNPTMYFSFYFLRKKEIWQENKSDFNKLNENSLRNVNKDDIKPNVQRLHK